MDSCHCCCQHACIAIHVLTFLGKVNGSPLVLLQEYVHNVNKHRVCLGLGKGLYFGSFTYIFLDKHSTLSHSTLSHSTLSHSTLSIYMYGMYVDETRQIVKQVN